MRKLTNIDGNENCSEHFSAEDLDNKLESSYEQYLKKEGRPMDEVFEELESGLKQQ